MEIKIEPMEIEKARSLNNEFIPMHGRVKILRKIDDSTEDNALKKAKAAGIVIPEEVKKKNSIEMAIGVIVAKGDAVDYYLEEGMVVEFGKYAGYMPVTGSPAPEGFKYNIISEDDITQIMMTYPEYKKRFLDTIQK